MSEQKFPTISAIVAMSSNRVIGKDNQLPWHLPADLKYFKTLTTGHPIIMGRKTYTSIGRPLPNRTNIIVTRDQAFTAAGCVIAHDVDEALRVASDIDQSEIFVIGGGQIYQLFLPVIDRLYLTLVHAELAGDAFLPDIFQSYQIVSREDYHKDEQNQYDYSFLCLERIKT